MLDYLKAENAYFEGWKAQHQGLIDQLVRGDEGADQGGRQLGPDPRRRFPLLVGVQARCAIPDLVPQARGRRRRPDRSSTSRSRPRARNISGSARWRSAPTESFWRRSPTTTGRSGSSLRIRDLATGKDVETVTKVGIGQPVWTSDSAGIVFTEVNDNGAAIARAITGSGGRRTRPSRSTRRPRSSASSSASASRRTKA